MCVYGHHFQQIGHQPGVVVNPAFDQLDRDAFRDGFHQNRNAPLSQSRVYQARQIYACRWCSPLRVRRHRAVSPNGSAINGSCLLTIVLVNRNEFRIFVYFVRWKVHGSFHWSFHYDASYLHYVRSELGNHNGAQVTLVLKRWTVAAAATREALSRSSRSCLHPLSL